MSSRRSGKSSSSGMEEFSRYDDKYWSSLLHDDFEMGESLKKPKQKAKAGASDQTGIADLSESHTVHFDFWTQYNDLDFGEYILSEVFSICGTDWQIQVCPKGFDDHFDNEDDVQVSCHLKHCGSKPVRCRYTLTLINETSPEKNIVWTDDEGVVSFGAMDSGSNVWGTEEFFPLSLINSDRIGYVRSDVLSINVVMEIYGDVHIDSHPLTKAIENTSADINDLKALAVSELSLITKTLPGTKTCLKAGEEFKYQDKIVRSRFPSSHSRSKHF